MVNCSYVRDLFAAFFLVLIILPRLAEGLPNCKKVLALATVDSQNDQTQLLWEEGRGPIVIEKDASVPSEIAKAVHELFVNKPSDKIVDIEPLGKGAYYVRLERRSGTGVSHSEKVYLSKEKNKDAQWIERTSRVVGSLDDEEMFGFRESWLSEEELKGKKILDAGAGVEGFVNHCRQFADCFGIDLYLSKRQQSLPYMAMADMRDTGLKKEQFDLVYSHWSYISYNVIDDAWEGSSAKKNVLSALKGLKEVTKVGGKIRLSPINSEVEVLQWLTMVPGLKMVDPSEIKDLGEVDIDVELLRVK